MDEPYRLFTSRSEFRLTVRQDNALRRLGVVALERGWLDAREGACVRDRLDEEDLALQLARTHNLRPDEANPLLERAGSAPILQPTRIAELAKRQRLDLHTLFVAAGLGEGVGLEASVSVELELKYAGYFERERLQAERRRPAVISVQRFPYRRRVAASSTIVEPSSIDTSEPTISLIPRSRAAVWASTMP